MIPTVVQVYAQQNYLIVQFDDGKIVRWDASALRQIGGVFTKLQDDRVFVEELTVLNGSVAWSRDFDPDHCIDLDPLRLYTEGEIINVTKEPDSE
ncbi:DUF2442 domain-containing protein [Sulfobacillus thermosulfidooxidans]|uniref:DUF2442 domain-containing protein n=1 Tax=Sulfobacillus thermosulfidooxidans TaxID=28034 RepID=UPI0002EBC660|nr:DUF2442 domain-containing protein [Sulfobacillus thermosulfidooxidans]